MELGCRNLRQAAADRRWRGERIRYFWESWPEDRFDLPDSHINELHRFKTRRYVELVDSGACGLRPGVADLIHRARDGRLRLAIVTTTSRDNIGALLSRNLLGPDWNWNFDVIVSGDDVPNKKPEPDAYHAAIDALGLPAASCLAIEDFSATVWLQRPPPALLS